MGKDEAGLVQGGGGFLELSTDILGGGSVGPLVWFIDVGDNAAHLEGVGQIPPQGGPQADRGQPRRGRYGVCIYPLLEDATM